MSWLADALGGPVLAWEIKRATRGKLGKSLRIAYFAWLVIVTLFMFQATRSVFRTFRGDSQARLVLYRIMQVQQFEILDKSLAGLLQMQLVLVMATVPALTASSLGQEKERGTLFALLATELTSRQILLAKLLGRLSLIASPVLTTLPALVFIASMTGKGLTLLVLALVQEAFVGFALGALCLLFGIWIRRAADAIVASYFFLGAAYLIIRPYTASLPGASCFDPVENIRAVLNKGSLLAFFAHLAAWAVLGVVCLRLGSWRLRKVCVDQRDKKPSRLLWAFRPAVGNDPIRWRECHVIGLAPLPFLRIVPRWLAVLGVFILSAAVAFALVNSVASGFTRAFLRNPVRVYGQMGSLQLVIQELVPFMGLIFVLFGILLIGVRCGTSVAEEKRQNTWSDLLLAAQSFREITTGKMRGILQAAVPYLVAYALPVFFFASMGGRSALVTAGLWILLPCAVVFIAVLFGVDMVRVPQDMDETREEGAFWFENERQHIYLRAQDARRR